MAETVETVPVSVVVPPKTRTVYVWASSSGDPRDTSRGAFYVSGYHATEDEARKLDPRWRSGTKDNGFQRIPADNWAVLLRLEIDPDSLRQISGTR